MSAAPKIPGKGKGHERNTPCPCGSGKKFKLCHGREDIVPVVPGAVPATPKLELAAPTTLLKLDLGCGNTPREGFEGVDIAGDKATHKVDLFKFPWPFEDNSVEEINLSHFMEHIPAREVEERDLAGTGWSEEARPNPARERFIGQDMMFAFFDEMWRILRHEGWVHIVVPCARNNRAFQDPTHRRFIVEDTFAYFWKDWRDQNIPQYKVRCNFVSEVNHSMLSEVGLRAAEVQGDLIRNRWNYVVDLMVKMKALKQ